MKADDHKMIIVTLYLRGDDLDPEVVTKKLGIRPSRFQRKGEKKVTSTKHEYLAKMGTWGLIADSESCLLADHITALASNIVADGDVLIKLPGVQEAYIDIFIAPTAGQDGGTRELELSKENLTQLARMGLPVRLTISHVKE
ncbi:protein of unknown function [Nitrosospira multiformis]|nr:protein of unknown function [Nitrosospira multiformis]